MKYPKSISFNSLSFNGELTKTLYIVIILLTQATMAFAQSAPTATAATNVTSSSFTANWTSVSGAFNYLLDVSTSATFGSYILQNQNTTSTSYAISSLSAGTYYYRVRSVTQQGTSAYSNNISVVVQSPPAAPTANAATSVTTSSFTASWNSSSGAGSYYLDVSTSSNFTSFVSGYNNASMGTSLSKSVTGLSGGTTYYYRVRGANGAGYSGNSNTITVTTILTIPPVPTGLLATSITSTSFVATWAASPSATSYELDVSVPGQSDFSYTLVLYNKLSVTGTSQAVTGLGANATYYYRVRAVNSAGMSLNSVTASATTLNIPPDPPPAYSATNLNGSSFTANWGTVANASGYTLDVATDIGFTNILTNYNNLNVNSSTDLTVSNLTGPLYYYRLRAYNSAGYSSYSNVITVSLVPPAPGTQSATNITPSSFTANWTSVTNATSYRLDVSTDSNFPGGSFIAGFQDRVVNGTSQDVTGLLSGTTYYFRMRAVGSYGTSASSNTVNVTTLIAPPSPNQASNVTTTSFTASWTAVTGAIGGYKLDISTDNFATFVTASGTTYNNLAVSGTSQNITGLTPGITYAYRLRACTNQCYYVTSNSTTVSVTLPLPPPPPVSISSLTSSSFVVNWTPPGGGVVVTGYSVQVYAAITNQLIYNTSATSASTSVSITGLVPCTTYNVQVGTIISGNNGNPQYSSPLPVTTIVDAPGLYAPASVTPTSFVANWSITGASYYQLDVSTDNAFQAGSGTFSYSPGGTSVAVSGLTSITFYYYRVRSVCSINAYSSSYSSSNITTLTLAPVATASTNVTSNSFSANWTPAVGATGYQLDVSTSSDFTAGTTTYNAPNVTTYSVTNLLRSSYFYRVRAMNSGTPPLPSANSNTINAVDLDHNYIKTTVVQKKGITVQAQVDAASIPDVAVAYAYVDGIGRPNQNVSVQSSPSQKDITQPIAYDLFGRQAKKYLPYVDPAESNGWFKENALKDPNTSANTEPAMYQSGKQFSFYQVGGLVASDLTPYAETRFKPDPLNRAVKQGSPGGAWQPDATDDYTSPDHTVKSDYDKNATNEVKLWTYTPSTATTPISLITTSYYAANQLYKTKTKDEQQNEVHEFKNKEGKTILKKVQAPGSNAWAETYYIYDDAGNLVVVLPPEAVKAIGIN